MVEPWLVAIICLPVGYALGVGVPWLIYFFYARHDKWCENRHKKKVMRKLRNFCLRHGGDGKLQCKTCPFSIWQEKFMGYTCELYRYLEKLGFAAIGVERSRNKIDKTKGQ